MDFRLTSEQELVRSSAREFAERELAPHTREWDRAEEIDRALVAKLADAGYLGAGWEEDYGGSGLDTVSYALVVEELGKVDSNVRGIVSVNVGLVGKTIARFGTSERSIASARSQSRVCGASSRSANSRAEDRMSSCSEVSPKSMPL